MEHKIFIPKEVWDKIPYDEKVKIEEINLNCPYPTTPGMHKTWMNLEKSGLFYVIRLLTSDIPDLERVATSLPKLQSEFKKSQYV